MSDEGRRKRIVLVRHAKSSWDDPAIADHDRTLSPRGRKAIGPLADHLARLSLRANLVLCSSSQRTRETLAGIRTALGADCRVEIEPDLYGADADALLARLRSVDDEIGCVVLVGHNPGIADLAGLLADPSRAGSAAVPDAFPTAAVAELSFTGPWHELQSAHAMLDSFWTPRHQS